MTLDPSLTTPPLVSLSPVAQYRESSQSSSCIVALPIHDTNTSNQSHSYEREKSSDSPGKGLYELWVGQKENKITVLDAASLEVVKFLYNSLDKSVMPSFVAYLSCNHLVYGSSTVKGAVSGKGEGQGACQHLNVYSALYHGQYVTRWDARKKQPVESFDCQDHANADEGQSTSYAF